MVLRELGEEQGGLGRNKRKTYTDVLHVTHLTLKVACLVCVYFPSPFLLYTIR